MCGPLFLGGRATRFTEPEQHSWSPPQLLHPTAAQSCPGAQAIGARAALEALGGPRPPRSTAPPPRSEAPQSPPLRITPSRRPRSAHTRRAPLQPPLSPGLPAPPSRPCRSSQPGSVAEERPERSAAQLNKEAAATAGTCRPTPGALIERRSPRGPRWANQRRVLSKGPKEIAGRANRKGLEAGLRGRVRRVLKAPHPHPPVRWWGAVRMEVSVGLAGSGALAPARAGQALSSTARSQPAVSAVPSCTHRHTPPGSGRIHLAGILYSLWMQGTAVNN